MTETAGPHRHRAFGLVFASGRPLPGWPEVSGTAAADVELSLQQRPRPGAGWREVTRSRHRSDDGEPLVRVDRRAGEYRFTYHDGARFHVDATGRQAWLDWPEESSLEAVWMYFCGPVLTWILRLHRRVVLHAAAASTRRGALLLAGPSGAGKSTTAAGLAIAGCRLLSDDTAALSPGESVRARGSAHRTAPETLVWPDSPRLRLWPCSGPAIGALDVGALPRLCDGWEKRAFDARSFEEQPQPVAAVYCLRPGPETSFATVAAPRALPLLVAHAAAAELADRDMRRREFELLSDLAAEVPVVLATRPDGRDLAPALLADFENRVAAYGGAPVGAGHV